MSNWKEMVDQMDELDSMKDARDYLQYRIEDKVKKANQVREVSAKQRQLELQKYLNGGLLSVDQIESLLEEYKNKS